MGRALLVEHRCPRCGAPQELEETDRLFQCQFCRVRLYILSRNFLRYLLPARTSEADELLYVPYWRFRGMYYSLVPYDVKKRILDMNFRAVEHGFLPDTMGLRAQTQRLRFAKPGMKAHFVAPDFPFSSVVEHAEEMSSAHDWLLSDENVMHRGFIGDMVSMLYFPVYIKGRALMDGVTGRPIGRMDSMRAESLQKSLDTQRNWRLRFLIALCPTCGWDLEGGRQSVALFCRNCEKAWEVSRGGALQKLSYAFMKNRESGMTYLPFWRLRASVEGLQTETHADLIRLGNLPRVIRPEWEEAQAFFWIPAFKTPPQLFLRLSKQVTVLQPDMELTERMPKDEMIPVTMGHDDANEMVIMTLSGIGKPKKRLFPAIPEVTVKVTDATLVYIPFKPGHHDYYQPAMRFSIPKNSLRSVNSV